MELYYLPSEAQQKAKDYIARFWAPDPVLEAYNRAAQELIKTTVRTKDPETGATIELTAPWAQLEYERLHVIRTAHIHRKNEALEAERKEIFKDSFSVNLGPLFS